MESAQELLPGCWVLRLHAHRDLRGLFVKTFSSRRFAQLGLPLDWPEEFYSVSGLHVLRGMHFQRPPHAHAKLVHCAVGSVRDVLLDLRRGPGQGCVASLVLDSREPSLLFIPPGIAHGFLALEAGSLMVYKTSTEYAPMHDDGIRWDSLAFDWGVTAPIVSARDAAHQALAEFDSPFGPP